MLHRPTQAIALSCCLTAALSMPQGAYASPWTLPRGDVAVVTGFGQRQARQEFFDNVSVGMRFSTLPDDVDEEIVEEEIVEEEIVEQAVRAEDPTEQPAAPDEATTPTGGAPPADAAKP